MNIRQWINRHILLRIGKTGYHVDYCVNCNKLFIQKNTIFGPMEGFCSEKCEIKYYIENQCSSLIPLDEEYEYINFPTKDQQYPQIDEDYQGNTFFGINSEVID